MRIPALAIPRLSEIPRPDGKSWPPYSPVHVSRVRRGVFACVLQQSLSRSAWECFRAWKDAPSAHPDVTEHLAAELVRLVREVLPVVPSELIVTTPPQGKSASEGREYAAGFLGRAVAARLDREYLTVFKPQSGKRYHGKFESLRRKEERFELLCVPDAPVIVVDDMITSGKTMQRALLTLADAGVVAHGFAYMSWG